MSDLRAVQEWMHDAITSPHGLPSEADRVVRGTAGLSADERLGLYRRSYRARMLDALRASYPALNHMLGPEAFDEFGLDYLHARPSRSYTLLRLAQGFPDHLAATRPDGDDEWSDLVIDIARLERTFTEVYEGEGSEGERLPAASDLPIDRDAGWHAVTVEMAPCVRLERYSHPVGPYVLACRHGEPAHPPQPGESFLAVGRRDFVVTFTALSGAEHRLLAALAEGAPLGPAAQAARLEPTAAWRLLRASADGHLFRKVTTAREPVTT